MARHYLPNLEWHWIVPTPIPLLDIFAVINATLARLDEHEPKGLREWSLRAFKRGDESHIVMRWYVQQLSACVLSARLRQGRYPDNRFTFLESKYLNAPFKGCEPPWALSAPVEPPAAPPEEPKPPVAHPVEPESLPEGIEPEMPPAEPAKSVEDLPSAQELAGPVPETPPAEPEAPAEPETPDPGPEGPAGDDLDGLETVGPAEPDQADQQPDQADHAEAPAPKPKRKYKKRKKAKRKTAKRKTN